MAYNKKKEAIPEPRINDEIRGYTQVRLINSSEDGKTTSTVMPLYDAKRKARDAGLDLIEINPKADPPIVKMEDYSKYLFELKKKLKAQKKNKQVLKEIQLSTNISDHDIDVKANKAREFIKEGDKVKVVLTMRGRELSRRDQSKKSIYLFITKLEDIAVPESMPKDEGNKCSVILKKK